MYCSPCCVDILGVGDEIPTYEQVIQLEPDQGLCRPIVLIGAPGVGRRTLIKKLMNSDPSHYRPVVQRKSSVKSEGEREVSSCGGREGGRKIEGRREILGREGGVVERREGGKDCV
jgi:hypothetical protein